MSNDARQTTLQILHGADPMKWDHFLHDHPYASDGRQTHRMSDSAKCMHEWKDCNVCRDVNGGMRERHCKKCGSVAIVFANR